jgi:hypothetical protein
MLPIAADMVQYYLHHLIGQMPVSELTRSLWRTAPGSGNKTLEEKAGQARDIDP